MVVFMLCPALMCQAGAALRARPAAIASLLPLHTAALSCYPVSSRPRSTLRPSAIHLIYLSSHSTTTHRRCARVLWWRLAGTGCSALPVSLREEAQDRPLPPGPRTAALLLGPFSGCGAVPRRGRLL